MKSKIMRYHDRQQVVKANRSEKYIEMSDRDRRKLLSDLIVLTIYRNGQDIPSVDELKALTIDFEGIIVRHFPQTRTEELRIAFENGVIGNYGSFFGINTKTFAAWLRSFYFDDNRRATIGEMLRSKKIESEKLDENEVKRRMEDAYRRRLDEFVRYGRCSDYGNAVYNYLDSLGMIRFTASDKQKIYEQACREINSEDGKRSGFRKPETEDEKKARIRMHAKKIALNKYFETITKINKQ